MTRLDDVTVADVSGWENLGARTVQDLRVKAVSDAPIVAGVGISTPNQAATGAEVTDGVIVGSALVRRVLEAPDAVIAEADLRTAVGELAASLDGSNS